jgi:hypothetical protein
MNPTSGIPEASVLAHLFLWLLIPTYVSRLITLWYLIHFVINIDMIKLLDHYTGQVFNADKYKGIFINPDKYIGKLV